MKTARSIDWVTIGVTIIGLVWGTYYVLSTRWNPIDEPEAAWLITPVLVALWICAPFVIRSAIGPLPERLEVDEAEGLHYPNRWLFVLGMPCLAGAIWLFGFMPSALVYAVVTVLGMGERRIKVHLIIVAIIIAIIVLGFEWGLNVHLPLWPRWI